MSQYDVIIFPALLVINILFLYHLTKIITGFSSRRLRVLVPVAATILYICAISLLTSLAHESSIGVLLIIVLPTLAMLTVFPLAESDHTEKNYKVMIALIAIPLTIGLLFYLWAWNFSGIPTIFLPIWVLFPSTGMISVQIQVLSMYGELLIICGTLGGVIRLTHTYGRNNSSVSSYQSSNEGQVAPIILLGIGSLFLNSLIVGFLVIFLYLTLRHIPSRPAQVFIPLVLALGIMYLVSLMPVVKVYSSLATGLYDFTLFALLLIAMGITTPFPLFEKYLIPYQETVLYVISTMTIMVLALLFHDPSQNFILILARGLSTITDSGVFAIGIPVAEGIARKLALFCSAVILSAALYTVMIIAIALVRKREGELSSTSVPSEQFGGTSSITDQI